MEGCDHLVEHSWGYRYRADHVVPGHGLRPEAAGELADRQQGGMTDGAGTGERLVGELVLGVQRGDALGANLQLEARELGEDTGLAPPRRAQPGPLLTVEVVGEAG